MLDLLLDYEPINNVPQKKEIAKEIEKIKKEQQENLEKIKQENKIINDFNIDDIVDEKKWLELTSTALTYNNTIIKALVLKIFPEAIEIYNGTDKVYFYITNKENSTKYKITLNKGNSKIKPTIIVTNNIKYPEKPKSIEERISENKDIQFCKKYIELITSKASWKEKARVRISKHIQNSWHLAYCYFFVILPKDKKYGRNLDWFKCKLDELTKMEETFYFSTLKVIEENKVYHKCYFEEIEPKLKNFSSNIKFDVYEFVNNN